MNQNSQFHLLGWGKGISGSWISPILLEELSIKHISACGMGEVWIIFGISNSHEKIP